MSAQEDRRANKPQRIPFDGIVELGGGSPDGAGFEAQAVDVSLGGMHLRTAYLPDVGQPLLCRFDGGGQEVNAEADVVWRREGTRGGEFGIRFTNLDGPGAELLMDACGARSSASMDAAGGDSHAERHEPKAGPGTRVRLHIDGLGSPMKARVRDSKHGEVMVGSNLEFLRVGRTLELEDVDHKGQKRAAHIDRVEVEIDAASRVPQLVVALRYDDMPADEAGELTTVRMDVPGMSMRMDGGSHAGGMDAEVAEERHATTARSAAENPMNDDEMRMAAQMKSKFSQAALQVGPALLRLGNRAKTTMALLAAKAKDRSRGGETAQVRRTTSPPPGGALHAEGKRVIRDDGEGERADARPAVGKAGLMGAMSVRRKKALAYGGIGVGAVTLLLVATRGGSGSKVAPPGATANAAEATPGAGNAAGPTAVAAAGATPGDGVTANVPLFGPTTLSTTEAVAPPAPGAAAGTPSGFATPGAGAAFGNSGSVADSAMGEGSDDESRSGGKHEDHAKVPPFIHGKVVHPVVLHVRTDGTIESMHAARSATGFTVTLPGRRASDSGSALGAKDPRIASVHVNNGAKGTELTFQFKDGVPAFALRAKGHDLQVALGRAPAGGDADETSHAHADRESSREAVHGTTAKKDEGRHSPHKTTR